MESNALRVALECLKGSAGGKLGDVEINDSVLRCSNGTWWADATLPASISTSIKIRHSTLRSIVMTLGKEDQVKMEEKGSRCFIQSSGGICKEDLPIEFDEMAGVIQPPGGIWCLNLRNSPSCPSPEFEPIQKIEVPSRPLLEAYKSLKHLIHSDLSRPGLMWTWTDDDQYLVVGDGFRLGAHHTGIKNLELPVKILSEMCRILSVCQSEEVILHIGENHIRATMGQVHFEATLPNGSRFETAWHKEMKSLLDDDPQILKVSRSELLLAVRRVKITAAESTVRIASAGRLILASIDERKDTSGSQVEACGSLREQISLNIEHLESALEALGDESVILKVCKSLVEVSDTSGWEIIPRR